MFFAENTPGGKVKPIIRASCATSYGSFKGVIADNAQRLSTTSSVVVSGRQAAVPTTSCWYVVVVDDTDLVLYCTRWTQWC